MDYNPSLGLLRADVWGNQVSLLFFDMSSSAAIAACLLIGIGS